jgi:hypothetical protein
MGIRPDTRFQLSGPEHTLRSAGLASVLVGCLAAALLLASRGASHSPARILHLSGFTVVTADAAKQPKLNEQSAEEVARSFAAGRLPETVGPVTRLNGREVAASDLELVERFFAPATTEVSSDSYGYKFTNTVPGPATWSCWTAARRVVKYA